MTSEMSVPSDSYFKKFIAIFSRCLVNLQLSSVYTINSINSITALWSVLNYPICDDVSLS